MDLCVHICTDGHVIFSRNRICGDEFCEKCGAKMIDVCPICNHVIKEWDYGRIPVVGTPEYSRASYCRNCGNPYPWTKTALEVATDLISEEAELSDLERKNLISSLPDIITETPKTSLAVIRFKKAAISAGKFTAEALRQFVIDFGCEFAKSQLGL